jgi:hypothetical protein
MWPSQPAKAVTAHNAANQHTQASLLLCCAITPNNKATLHNSVEAKAAAKRKRSLVKAVAPKDAQQSR